jgi:hypothetical protein
MNAPSPRPTGTLAFNAAATALLAWLYSGDVYDGLRARTAEVSAFADVPNIGFAAAALVATLVGAGVTVAGALRKRDGSWKGYRVVPVLAVLILFVDLFVLSVEKVPMGAPDRVALAISALAQHATDGSSPEGVLASKEALEEFVKSLGPPPLLVRGAPRARWELSLRANCTGPAADLAGEAPGTLVYCVAADRQHAWVSAVAFPREQRFGPPGVFTVGGVPFSAEVLPLPSEAADDGEGVVLDDDGGVVAAP